MSFLKVDLKEYNRQLHADDPRITSKVVSTAEEADYILLGYPDDEGIKLNGGRVGAALAPHEIRKSFYKLTTGTLPHFSLFDGGNIDIRLPLAERHQAALQTVEKYYRSGKFLLSLGGGHDYGFPDTQGFLEAFKNSKL